MRVLPIVLGYVSEIMVKLDVATRAEVVALAVQSGIIDNPGACDDATSQS